MKLTPALVEFCERHNTNPLTVALLEKWSRTEDLRGFMAGKPLDVRYPNDSRGERIERARRSADANNAAKMRRRRGGWSIVGEEWW